MTEFNRLIGCCGIYKESNSVYELGHSYDNISIIKKNWLNEDITNNWINSCCTNSDIDYFQEDNSGVIFFFMLLFIIISLYFTFLYYERQYIQPLKARKFNLCLYFLILLNITNIFINMNRLSALSGSCFLELFILFIIIPLIALHYLQKAYSLYYIYGWNKCKAKCNYNKIRWYQKNKWILNTKTYIIVIISLLSFNFIIFSIILINNPYLIDGNDTYAASSRCEWWDIPNQYHAENYMNKSICSCSEELYTEKICQASLYEFCKGISPPDSPPDRLLLKRYLQDNTTYNNITDNFYDDDSIYVPDNSTLCASCLLDISSNKCQQNLKKSTDYLWNNYECGWYDKVPDFSTCKFCFLSSSSTSGFVLFIISSIFIISSFLFWKIRKMRDKLWIRQEIAGVCIILFPLLFIIILNIFSDELNLTFLNNRDIDKTLFYFIIIIIWWCLILSIIIPVWISVLYHPEVKPKHKILYPLYNLLKILVLKVEKKGIKKRRASAISMRVIKQKQKITSTPSNINDNISFLKTMNIEKISKKGISLLLNDHENSDLLIFCLQNTSACRIYMNFATKEFTVENILFLIAINELIHLSPILNENELTKEIINIFKNFIHTSSSLQVNISSKTASDLSTNLFGKIYKNKLPKNLKINLKNKNDKITIYYFFEIYQNAILEVQKLILSDSWKRFERTKGYNNLIEIWESEESMNNITGGVISEGTFQMPSFAAVGHFSDRKSTITYENIRNTNASEEKNTTYNPLNIEMT